MEKLSVQYKQKTYYIQLSPFESESKECKLWIHNYNYSLCKQVVDAFFILKNKNLDSADKKELEDFKLVSEKYKSAVIKPDLNEDARRFLVQATTATEEKRYNDAIDLLEKAITADPAYPQAHFNRALLWAQVSIYGAAILEMKKYLMLVPDATDARASQDKIYEWEGKLNR
ncbi:MAG TPA: tetratricopeptide repeat protein [Chitinophagaceae bacterium]|nr:tetratricopeptide repeat protein [Chitinophagaceae bacterium]